MSTSTQRDCQTDKIITDAMLRDVKVIDYNKIILDRQQDLESLREILKRNGLSQDKNLKELESAIHALEKQATEWIQSVGLQPHRDVAITILLEEVKS